MSNGQTLTSNALKIAAHRLFGDSTYSAPSKFQMGAGTTTPTMSDSAMASSILIGSVSSKAIAAGYPSYDDGNNNVTTRGIVLLTEGNGYAITEFGLINTDGTPLLFSRAVYSPVTKTSSVQIIFVEKDRIL